VVIRSYRSVFNLERRIYRIDRVRLNPSGIPIRGIVYLLGLIALALFAARLPLIGLVAHVLPVYVRDLALPALIAALLTLVRIEGRPFHLAIRPMLRCVGGSSRIVGFRARARTSKRMPEVWRPDPILMVPDGSDMRMRRLRYRGPGALLVAVPYRRRVRRGPLVSLGFRSQLLLRELPGAPRPSRGEVIVLGEAGRLSVE